MRAARPRRAWARFCAQLPSFQRRRTRFIPSAAPSEATSTALLLRDIAGTSNEETARILEITPNAAKIRLHRARQALRTLLDGRFGRSPS